MIDAYRRLRFQRRREACTSERYEIVCIQLCTSRMFVSLRMVNGTVLRAVGPREMHGKPNLSFPILERVLKRNRVVCICAARQ